jgi:hypothetical protein
MAISVPDYVQTAARRGLEWHAEGKSGDGVTDKTLREAREMADGSVSEDKLRRMGPWFRRHRADMDAPNNKPDGEDFPGAGAVAWALWGGPTSGDIMRTAEWAERKVEQIDREQSANNSNQSKHKMTIEEQLLEATAAISGVTAERDDLRATVEKLTVGAASELEALKVEAASKDAKLAELTAALEVAVKEVEGFKAQVAQHEATKVSASKEAAKIAASVGVSPVEISPSDAKPSAEAVDHLATFLSLPVGSKERNDYFAANKAAIIKAAI